MSLSRSVTETALGKPEWKRPSPGTATLQGMRGGGFRGDRDGYHRARHGQRAPRGIFHST